MSDEIILYDLGSVEEPKAWSANPLKTRIYLNYKKLPYKTVFLPIHKVQTEMKDLGFPAHQEGKGYSIPGVVFNGQKIMDSWKIAQAIEKVHPSPSAHLDSPYVEAMADNLAKFVSCMQSVFASKVFARHFDEADRQFFLTQRLAPYGIKSVDEFVDNTDKPWIAVRETLDAIAKLLKENTEGPFFMGKEFSYADVYWAAGLQFGNRVDDEFFQRIIGHDKVFAEFYTACKPVLERDT